MPDPLVHVDPRKAGALASDLLCREASWVRRRKLRVDFIDDVAMRLRQSVDFCIPDEAKPISRKGIGRKYVHLPLFVLRKAPQELIDFDLVDARNTALSLPTRDANAELSRHALLSRASLVLGGATGSRKVPEQLTALIDQIATADPPVSLNACDQLIGASPPTLPLPPQTPQDFLARDGSFRFLATLVSWSSIVAMPVEMTPGQKLLKLAYSEPIAGWADNWKIAIRAGLSPLPAQIDLPFVGAQTFHLETHPPQGMTVSAGSLAVRTPTKLEFREAPSTGRSVHLYMPEVDRGRSGAAFLELGVQRAGFMDNARTACMAVTGVLALSIAFAGPLARANKTVPTLLLFLPGLLATLVLQPTAHALTRRVLTVVRYAIMLCATLAFLAAFLLVAAPTVSQVETSNSGTATAKHSGEVFEHAIPTHRHSHRGQSAPRTRANSGPISTSPTQSTESERPSTTWLRIAWGVLLLISAAATTLVWKARGRAQP